jgi:hypothetical protein
VSSDWGFYLNTHNGIAQENVANNSPSNTLKLLDLEDSTFSNCSVCRFIAPKYTMPTYFTTMALFVGGDMRVLDNNYKKEISSCAAVYNCNGGFHKYVMRFQRSADDRFILLDPSHRALAKFLAATPTTNSFFPTAIFNMNEKGSNFVSDNIVKDRDMRMKRHEVKSFHDKHVVCPLLFTVVMSYIYS